VKSNGVSVEMSVADNKLGWKFCNLTPQTTLQQKTGSGLTRVSLTCDSHVGKGSVWRTAYRDAETVDFDLGGANRVCVVRVGSVLPP
jgi:hypothetical protein